jgi:phage major head subunit gpT-like protein
MEVTQASLDIIFRQASLQFQTVVESYTPWSEKIAVTIPSSGASMTYGWVDRLPSLRKWVGNRVINSVSTHARTVINDLFEQTFGLRRVDVEDDQLGMFSAALRMQAMESAIWPDVQVSNFLRSANSTTGFDGVGVYATTHPLLGGDVTGIPSDITQSNLFVSTALSWDNFNTVRSAMQSWVGADQQPLGIMPDTLVVPPQLEGVAKLILESDFLSNFAGQGAAPATNVLKGVAKVLVVPQLANKPNNWWLMDTSKPIKPLLWQLRQPPRFTYKTNPSDDNVFLSNQFLYGVDARGAAAETVWFLSAAATSASTY